MSYRLWEPVSLCPDEQVPEKRMIRWPGDATLAVCLGFEVWGSVVISALQIVNSTVDFGVKRGLWSVLDILARHNTKATFFVNGLTAETHPEIVPALVEAGHCVAPLGYDLKSHWNLNQEEERTQIQQGIAAIASAAGVRPSGWRTPYSRPSRSTLPLLVEAGITWDSTLRNDEMVSKLPFGPGALIEVPFGGPLDYNYYSSFPGPVKLVNGVATTYLDELEVLHAESQGAGGMAVLNFNPSFTGRPAELAMLNTILEKLESYGTSVWLARFDEVEGWVSEHDDWFAEAASLS